MNALRVWPAALYYSLSAGCHRVIAPTSVVYMGDPSRANQLISGFYGVEGGGGGDAWRWTGPDFSLALAPPAAARRGARLLLRLYFPETQIQKLGPMTLTAFVDGQPLAPKPSKRAAATILCGIFRPAFSIRTCCQSASVSISYSPKSGADGRDLGAVVLMAALEAK
jgi:hypothetical protein